MAIEKLRWAFGPMLAVSALAVSALAAGCANGGTPPTDAGRARVDGGPIAMSDAGPIEAEDAASPGVDAPGPGGEDAGPSAAFSLAYLPAAGTSWVSVAVSGEVPTEPIEEAFGPEGLLELVVLTHRSVYLFNPASRRFTERLDRDVVFPELAGQTITTAYSFRGTDVTITATDAYVYGWDHATRTATLDTVVDASTRWPNDDPFSPRPWAELSWSVAVPGDPNGWAPVPPERMCAVSLGYIVTNERAAGDTGYGTCAFFSGDCLRWIAKSACESYPPFSLPGAPSRAAAVAWHDGFWAFTNR